MVLHAEAEFILILIGLCKGIGVYIILLSLYSSDRSVERGVLGPYGTCCSFFSHRKDSQTDMVITKRYLRFGVLAGHLSINETMVPYFGRSSEMFIRGKPTQAY